MTVHKSQGQTLKLGVIDFTNIERSLGSSYVQLTRFQNNKQFLVMPFPFSRITTQIKKSISLKPRMAEEERLNTLTARYSLLKVYLLYLYLCILIFLIETFGITLSIIKLIS